MNMNTQELEATSVTFALLGRMICEEPCAAWLRECDTEGYFLEVPFPSPSPMIAEAASQIQQFVEESQGCESDAAARLKREWLRLLVGVGVPEAPPIASFYLHPNHHVLSAATLAARRQYRLFDLELSGRKDVQDDHLGVSLVFLSELLKREALSRESASGCNCAEAEKLSEAQRLCLEESVLPWLAVWRHDMNRSSTTAYYQGLSAMIFECIRLFVRRFNIEWDQSGRRFVRGSADIAFAC